MASVCNICKNVMVRESWQLWKYLKWGIILRSDYINISRYNFEIFKIDQYFIIMAVIKVKDLGASISTYYLGQAVVFILSVPFSIKKFSNPQIFY